MLLFIKCNNKDDKMYTKHKNGKKPTTLNSFKYIKYFLFA